MAQQRRRRRRNNGNATMARQWRDNGNATTLQQRRRDNSGDNGTTTAAMAQRRCDDSGDGGDGLTEATAICSRGGGWSARLQRNDGTTAVATARQQRRLPEVGGATMAVMA
jgi:hypothetical protein